MVETGEKHFDHFAMEFSRLAIWHMARASMPVWARGVGGILLLTVYYRTVIITQSALR